MPVVTDKRDLTLIALALAGNEEMDGVHLQKAVFLLQKKLPSSVLPLSSYNFVEHHYGPYDRLVYAHALLFADQGLAVNPSNSRSYKSVVINQHGKTRGFSILQRMPPLVAIWAADIIAWVQSQSFDRLVAAVYEEYPEWKAKSIFRGLVNRFLPHSNAVPSTRDIPRTRIIDEARVERFLQQHSFLLPLILDARAQLHKFFPDAQLSLEVVNDPESDEGDETLVLRVWTQPEREDAHERLRQFDKSWWLGKIREAQGMLAITLSYQ